MATRRTIEFLDGQRVEYTLIHHPPAYTAQEVAAATHISGKRLAKAVIVNIDNNLAMAVVPADREVEMGLLRSATGARTVALADESEFADRFEGCQLGTMPPLGNVFGMETFVDHELAKEEYIAFNAGSHTDVIAVRFADYQRIVHPKLMHFSTSPTPSLSSLRTAQI